MFCVANIFCVYVQVQRVQTDTSAVCFPFVTMTYLLQNDIFKRAALWMLLSDLLKSPLETWYKIYKIPKQIIDYQNFYQTNLEGGNVLHFLKWKNLNSMAISHHRPGSSLGKQAVLSFNHRHQYQLSVFWLASLPPPFHCPSVTAQFQISSPVNACL